MEKTNKIIMAILAAGLCTPAAAQDKPVHVKMIRIIDGDTTIVEKDADEDELEKEMRALRGNKASLEVLIDKRAKANGGAHPGSNFFYFNGTTADAPRLKQEFIIDLNDPAMRFLLYDSELPPGEFPGMGEAMDFHFKLDTLLAKESRPMPMEEEEFFRFHDSLGKAIGEQIGYSFSISDTDGEVIVKQLGPEGEKVIIKKLEGEPGEELQEDIVLRSKDGKTMTRVIVKTTVRIEDMETPSGEKAPVKSKSEEFEGLRFYPNPNSGKFNIDFEIEGKDPVLIRITDMNGKEVYREEVRASGRYSSQVDISKQGKGAYILKIEQGKRSATKTIVIE
jgi:hypothetical protein